MKAPPNTTKVLKAEAQRLTDYIFRKRYCIVHYKKSGKQVYFKVEKHHLIKKSQSTRYQFNIRNILPICENKHLFDKNSAHENERKFMAWVKEKLPIHWAWFQKHRYEPPQTLYEGDWSEICDELRHYANHPNEAEKIIYEIDSL